jgi:NAD(P)-dependent dehydrogenase (short-subunit alcohol dehydrogenase family)
VISEIFLAPHELRNRIAVVTGASAGVGRAVALKLSRAGAKVGLIAREADALDALRTEIVSRGGQAFAASADVGDPEAVFAAAQEIESQLGPISLWINDAMVTVFSPLAEMQPEEFRRVTEVTYLGCVHGTMAALRHMRPRDFGTIIQIGSALAYRGIPLQSAYCGAKHAIRGFTDSLRTELLHEGSQIRVTVVELPAVNTPQFDWARTHLARSPRPVAPVFQPEAIAQRIVHAARYPIREYWLGRSTFLTILGNFVAPGLLDRYLARAAVEGQQRSIPVSRSRQDNLFHPVSGLHRQRGSFGHEAYEHVVSVPGPLARMGIFTLGSGIAFGLGYMASQYRHSGRNRAVGSSQRVRSVRRPTGTR